MSARRPGLLGNCRLLESLNDPDRDWRHGHVIILVWTNIICSGACRELLSRRASSSAVSSARDDIPEFDSIRSVLGDLGAVRFAKLRKASLLPEEYILPLSIAIFAVGFSRY